MKTVVINKDSIVHGWFIVDAAEIPIGRLASKIANLLIGKSKVAYSPNQDHGDFVIVVNSAKARFTGTKAETKTYFRASTKPGSSKYIPFKRQMTIDATQVIRHAVWGMIPKGPLGRAIYKKLHVYKGDTHPHAAQKPQVLKLS